MKGVELAILIGGGQKPIRDAIDRAEHCGYLVSAFGGRAGHKLTFVSPEMTPPTVPIPDVNDTLRGSIPLNESPGGTNSAPVVVDDDDVTDPPISPPLDERTEGAIEDHAELLAGCRGALRDYLVDRVPERRRYAYVRTLAGWLDRGGDPSVWKLPDGSSLPPPDRPSVLAAALNEIAASDERHMKRPVGEPANLKTKIDILLKQRSRNGGSGGRSHGSRTPAAGRGTTPAPRNQPERRNPWGANLDEAG